MISHDYQATVGGALVAPLPTTCTMRGTTHTMLDATPFTLSAIPIMQGSTGGLDVRMRPHALDSQLSGNSLGHSPHQGG